MAIFSWRQLLVWGKLKIDELKETVELKGRKSKSILNVWSELRSEIWEIAPDYLWHATKMCFYWTYRGLESGHEPICSVDANKLRFVSTRKLLVTNGSARLHHWASRVTSDDVYSRTNINRVQNVDFLFDGIPDAVLQSPRIHCVRLMEMHLASNKL